MFLADVVAVAAFVAGVVVVVAVVAILLLRCCMFESFSICFMFREDSDTPWPKARRVFFNSNILDMFQKTHTGESIKSMVSGKSWGRNQWILDWSKVH